MIAVYDVAEADAYMDAQAEVIRKLRAQLKELERGDIMHMRITV